MKEYCFKTDTTHQAIIFEKGSDCDNDETHSGSSDGMVVGSSEWGWISEDNGRRICAALKYFSETSTEDIEKLANEKLKMTNDEHSKLIDDVIDWACEEDPHNIKKWEHFLDQYLILKGWEPKARKQFIYMGNETNLAKFLEIETTVKSFYDDVYYCSDLMSFDRLFRLHIQYRTLQRA